MGSCVSVQKKSDSAMKLRLSFGSKTDKLVIPSPVKDKPMAAEADFKSQRTPTRSASTFEDFGSKEETFFDSHPWLESDCEDDFFSVNGDFTPSRGNTPVHQNISVGTLRVNKALFEERAPKPFLEPSPTYKKKKLAELFRESSGGDQDNDQAISGNQNITGGGLEGKPTISDILPKSANETPYISGMNSVCSSEKTTPNGDSKPEKEKSIRSVQCCLPSFVSSCSSSERKKRMSPIHGRG